MAGLEAAREWQAQKPKLSYISEVEAIRVVEDPQRYAPSLVDFGNFIAGTDPPDAERRRGRLKWAIISGVTETSEGVHETGILINFPGFIMRGIARARKKEPQAVVQVKRGVSVSAFGDELTEN